MKTQVSMLRVWTVCALGLFIDGFDLYITSVAEPFFHKQFNLTPTYTGLVQAATPIGAAIGAIVVGRIADRLGRKSLLVFNFAFFVVAAILSGLAWDATSLIVLRFLVGFGVGADYPICASYLAEMTPTRNRGKLAAGAMLVNCVASPVGVLIAYIIFKSSDSLNAWRYMFMFGAVPALIGLYMRTKLPESFVWNALRHLQTASSKAKESIKRYKIIFGPKFLVVTLALSFCWLLQDISYYGIGLFTPSILQAMHLSSSGNFITDTNVVVLATLFVNVFIVVGAIVPVFLIDKVGRVRLQKIGFLVSFVALFVLGLGAYFHGLRTDAIILGWFAVFNIFINLGPGITTYLLPAEIYPTNVRATGHGVASGAAKLGAFLGALFLPILQHAVGIYMTVLMLSFTALLGYFLSNLIPHKGGEHFAIDDEKSGLVVTDGVYE